MPVVRNRAYAASQGAANGIIKMNDAMTDQDLLVSKKMQQFNEEYSSSKLNGSLSSEFHANVKHEDEVFLDTSSLGAHEGGPRESKSARSSRGQQNEDPLIIFDGQSNGSIAQTARDQFASALLRLQAGLAESNKRLTSIENKVNEVMKQRNSQTRSADNQRAGRGASAPRFGIGQLGQIAYFSWPILVYLAMRALERRSLAQKLT